MTRPYRSLALLGGASALAVGMALPAAAQDIPETSVAFTGSWSSLVLHQDFEQPFWGERIPEVSNGQISTEITTFDAMGGDGSEVFNLLQQGVFDVGATVGDYTAADIPELEALDFPMAAPDPQSAWDAAEAFKPILDDALQERFDARLVSVVPYPRQIIFCNGEIDGLADIEGKQVRASGRTTAEFLEALGAEGITMAFGEVPGALETGVVDCAITGSLSGYSSGWHEVSTHVYPLPMGGWDHVITAANGDFWRSLDPAARDLIRQEAENTFEQQVWENSFDETEIGVNCLTGRDTCPHGEPGDMTLVEQKPADVELARQLLEDEVMPQWAERVDDTWVRRWNVTVGRVLDLHIEH